MLRRLTSGSGTMFYRDCTAATHILTTSCPSPQEHLHHLWQVFQRLHNHGVISKCEFRATSLQFLGHRIDGTGIQPLEREVQTVSSPKLCTYSKMCESLWLVNFYHCFHPHAADLLISLHELPFRSTQSTKPLVWTKQAYSAFNAAKETLVNAMLLSHLQPNAHLAIMSDAYDIAVGTILQQRIGNQWETISYFSRKLTPTEQCYSTFDWELLAIYLAICHFH